MISTHWGVHHRFRTAVLVAVAAAVLGAAPAASAGWHWSKPISLPGANQGISSISCPSAHLCLAAAAVGNPETNGTNDIFWTTKPTGGRSSWHRVALERSVQPALGGSQEELITGVSCGKAGSSFHCGASDGFANFWQTGAPTSGVWNPQIPTSTGLLGVSCWSAWCAMLDSNTTVAVEIGATIENATTNVLGAPELLSEGSIGCDTAMFCAAADVSHRIAWTTDATNSSPDSVPVDMKPSSRTVRWAVRNRRRMRLPEASATFAITSAIVLSRQVFLDPVLMWAMSAFAAAWSISTPARAAGSSCSGVTPATPKWPRIRPRTRS